MNREIIKQLCDNLLAKGYYPFQITTMLEETVGTSIIENIASQDEERLIEVLNQYNVFADKCKKIKK